MAATGPSDPLIAIGPETSRGVRVAVGQLLIVVAVIASLLIPILDVTQAPPSVPAGHGHEVPVTSSVSHSADAVWIAAEGILTLLIGLGLAVPGILRSERAFALVSALGLLYVDGVIHWFAILDHLGEPPSAAFFAVAGAVQVLAIPIVLRRERALWWVGVVLTVFFIELFFVARFVPPPFAVEPESFEGTGLLSKGAEFGILAALALYFRADFVPSRLRLPFRSRAFAGVLLTGAVVTDAVAGMEALWGLLPLEVFALAILLLLAFVLAVVAAHVRPGGSTAAIAWLGASTLALGHALYAWYFAALSLVLPLLLCVVGVAILGAPIVLAPLARRAFLVLPPVGHGSG